MQREQLTRQTNAKQAALCLFLLVLALVFAHLASLKMTLSMFPGQDSMDTMQMVHADTQEQQHCHVDSVPNCQVSDNSHDHQGCTQAHCSTLPVLATQFNLVAVALAVEQQGFSTPRMLSGETNTPYIPPIA